MGKSKHGVYIAPNLVTTAALMFGFYAILAAINGDFHRGAACIFIAMLLDGIDGRVARWVGGESQFGEQYDSLSDLLSFGVAPAILIYRWSLSSTEHLNWLPERFSWVIAFIYCACAALRLARFNTQITRVDARFFIGLPSPSAAGMLTGFVWVCDDYGIDGESIVALSVMLTLFAGLMMVVPIKYFSFKKMPLSKKAPFIAVVLILLVLALVSIKPAVVLWLIFTFYALHGPIRYVYRRLFVSSKQSV